MTFKIAHYREKCIGCNSCVELSPSRWEISGEDGKSVLRGAVKKKDVYVAEVQDDEIEDNELAARDCPMGIIKILKK